MTCKTVTTKKAGGKKVTKQVCTAKLVSGPVKFTIHDPDAAASISQGHTMYARGTAVRTGSGRWRLVLTVLRSMAAGHYTLNLHTRTGSRRLQIRIA